MNPEYSRDIANNLINRSILITSLGLNGAIQDIDLSDLLLDKNSHDFTIRGLLDIKTPLDFIRGFASNLTSSLAKRKMISAENRKKIFQEILSEDCTTEKIKEQIGFCIKSLSAKGAKDQLTVIIVNGIEIVFLQEEYELILKELISLLQVYPDVRFIFNCDRSIINRERVQNSETIINEYIHIINLATKMSSEICETEIKRALPSASTEMIVAIKELSGGIPKFVKLLCDEINSLKDSFIGNQGDLPYKAADIFIHGPKSDIFEHWWSHLSHGEQLLILIALDEEQANESSPHSEAVNPIHVFELREAIRRRSGVDIDISPILRNLEYKGMLEDNAGYRFTSKLQETWLLSSFDQRDPLHREIAMRLLALAKSPTSYDIQILRNNIEPIVIPIIRKKHTIEDPIILHLSDIQFGKAHAFEDIPPEKYDSLLSSLITDIERNYNNDGIQIPNLIVISGDLADWGMPKEYKMAKKLLTGLLLGINGIRGHPPYLTEDNVVIIPGNHDITWALSDAGLMKQPDDSFIANDLYNYRFSPFREFFTGFYSGRRNISNDPDDDYAIYNFIDQFGLLIVGFNSCVQEDSKHHFGKISINAIRNAEGEINNQREKVRMPLNPIRCKMAVWHHNIGYSSASLDSLTDADDIINELKYFGYSICLFGHVHELEAFEIGPDSRTPLKLFGAGSLGVRSDQRPGSTLHGTYPLSYNIVSLNLSSNPNSVKVNVRQGFSKAGGVEWKPLACWPKNSGLFYEEPLSSHS